MNTFVRSWYIQRILPVLIIFLVVQLFLGSFLFFLNSLSETRANLLKEIDRVSEDVKFAQGKWDTSLYNADSNIPSNAPLYIITSEGFVIDRWKPIHGLLDVSEFTHILAYSAPQTINTITNENWRVLSAPISNGNEVVGAILVTAYKPDPQSFDIIDKQLTQTISDIRQVISVTNETINVTRLDPRKLPYNITYQIVNKFNKILIQSDSVNSITRTPTFIDSSYVDNQLKAPREQQIADSQTQENFLVETSPMYDNANNIIGIIVAGAPISSLYDVIRTHLVTFGLAGSTALLLFSPLFIFLLRKGVSRGISLSLAKKIPDTIYFVKKDSKLFFDDRSIDIPYASYQYYFCDALFTKPTKRWEVDELLELFGETIGNNEWRKVYDTMIALNKKISEILGEKLFIVKNKTYRINPQLVAKITHPS